MNHQATCVAGERKIGKTDVKLITRFHRHKFTTVNKTVRPNVRHSYNECVRCGAKRIKKNEKTS